MNNLNTQDFLYISLIIVIIVVGLYTVSPDFIKHPVYIALKDITSFSLTLVGLVIASGGLSTWKDKFKHELARRCLKSAYKVRDAIKFVRNPFISIDEMAKSAKEANLSEEEYLDRTKSNRAVYSERWKRIQEAQLELSADLLEAEATWGKPAVNSVIKLDGLVRELFFNLKMFLEVRTTLHDREIIYDMGETDEFNPKVNKAIKEIEDFLKPYLR